ncbi:MAG: DUF4252 domain-containing protein [Candidatus Zixiibacteriota bacterium]
MKTTRGIRRVTGAILIALAGLSQTGCLRATQLERIGAEIAWQHPEARFKREFSLSLGSVSMGLARLVVGVAGEDAREAKAYLEGVRRIEFAIYEVRGMEDVNDTDTPEIIEELIADDGWEMIVKSKNEGDLVWILYREDDGKVKDLLLTVLEDDEMVLINLSGHLDRVFAEALEDHSELTDMVGRNKP